MYASGDITTYVSRLHQLPTGSGDFQSFETEGYSYTGVTFFPIIHARRIMQHMAYSVLNRSTLADQFFTGQYYFNLNSLNWYYGIEAEDNMLDNSNSFSQWSINPLGRADIPDTKTSSGMYLIQSGTAEYFRIEATGLTSNSEYFLRVAVGGASASANGNIRLMGSGQDGANIWPVFPNQGGINYDLSAGTGYKYVRVKTDSSSTGSHRLTFRHATSPDTEWFLISQVNLYPIPTRSSAKIAILGDRTASYSTANANGVARAMLNVSGDTLNIIGVGDFADGSTQYSVNNDVKTGINGYTGISGLGGNMYMVPGNWDYTNDSDLSNFRDYFGFNGFTYPNSYNGSGSYKVTLGNIDFFLIDSVRIKDAASTGAAAALAEGQFLLTGLQASTSPWKIVVWHYPSHTSSSHHSQIVYPSQRWNWSGLGVNAVLSSHDHVYERFLVSGCYYFTLGIGGGGINTFGTRQPFSMASGVSYGYLKIHDSPTELIFEYLSTGNDLLDRAKILRYQA